MIEISKQLAKICTFVFVSMLLSGQWVSMLYLEMVCGGVDFYKMTKVFY